MLYTIEIDNNKYVIDVTETEVNIINEMNSKSKSESESDAEILMDIPDFDWEEDSNDQSHVVRAAMPGSVLAVNVKKGDQVKKQDVIAVFESMKMENEIVADRDGTIDEIYIHVGDKIKRNQNICVVL